MSYHYERDGIEIDLDTFTTEYIVALLWSSGEEFDDYCINDMSIESITKIIADCNKFFEMTETI